MVTQVCYYPTAMITMVGLDLWSHCLQTGQGVVSLFNKTATPVFVEHGLQWHNLEDIQMTVTKIQLNDSLFWLVPHWGLTAYCPLQPNSSSLFCLTTRTQKYSFLTLTWNDLLSIYCLLSLDTRLCYSFPLSVYTVCIWATEFNWLYRTQFPSALILFILKNLNVMRICKLLLSLLNNLIIRIQA